MIKGLNIKKRMVSGVVLVFVLFFFLHIPIGADENQSHPTDQEIVYWLGRIDYNTKSARLFYKKFNPEKVLPLFHKILIKNPEEYRSKVRKTVFDVLYKLELTSRQRERIYPWFSAYILKENLPFHKRGIIRSFAELYSESALPALFTFLYDEDNYNRYISLEKIKKTGHHQGVLLGLKIFHQQVKKRSGNRSPNKEWLFPKPFKKTIERIQNRIPEKHSGPVRLKHFLSKNKNTVRKKILTLKDANLNWAYGITVIPFLYESDSGLRSAALRTLKTMGNQWILLALKIWHRQMAQADQKSNKTWLDNRTEEKYQEAVDTIENRISKHKGKKNSPEPKEQKNDKRK